MATVSRQSSFQIDRSGLLGQKILKPTRVKKETQDLPRKFANFHNRNGALQMTTLKETGMKAGKTGVFKKKLLRFSSVHDTCFQHEADTEFCAVSA